MARTQAPPVEDRAVHDLHCHILPNWDDGPKTLEETLAMVERAAAAGLKVIVATPHVGRAFRGKERPADSIATGVVELQKAIDASGIPIQIVSGAEILLGQVDVLAGSTLKPEWTYGGAGKYALVESPFPTWPDFGNNLIYEIVRRGVTPIIAHPERYMSVQKNIDVLHGAVNHGALLQITAESLCGANVPRPMRECALRLVKAGWVHIVASDAHNAQAALPHETWGILSRWMGPKRARQILVENPEAILAGNSLSTQHEPEPVQVSPWKRLVGL